MTPTPLNEYQVQALNTLPDRPLGQRFPYMLRFALLVALFTAVVLLLQGLAGCFTTELSGYPDEPAHLITGLMVHDYAVSGLKNSPLEFAEKYYLHYPKVGFGIWPPLFHFVEGAWFFLLPASKISVFALQAFIAGLLATLVTVLTSRFYGWVLGVAAGLVFVSLPMIQVYTAMIMADGLMALFAFLSMLAFAAWAESRRLRHAILLGVCIGLALMTKSNAAALALLPVIGLLLLRQYRRLFSPALILGGVIALAIAMPWELLAMRLWTSTVNTTAYSSSYAMNMFLTHLRIYFSACGPVLFPLVAVGFFRKAILPYFHRTIEPIWAAAAALPIALFLFGFAPLPPEPRYHIASVASMCLFAAAGFSWLADVASSLRGATWIRPALAALIAFLYVSITLTVPQRLSFGYSNLAADLISNPRFHRSVMLVSSENAGEGMFIAEIALREPRPSHYILRATKVLSRSRWNLDSYELLRKTPEEVMKYLESIPVRLLIVDDTPGPIKVPHHGLLKQTVALYQDKWSHIASYPRSGPNSAGGRIEVYEYTGPAKDGGTIDLDLYYTLDKIR